MPPGYSKSRVTLALVKTRSESWLRAFLGASLFFLGLAFGWAAALRMPSPGLQPAWLLLAAASVCTLALGAVVGGLKGLRSGHDTPEWGRPVALDEVWRAARVHGRQAPLWNLPRTTSRIFSFSGAETLSFEQACEVIVEVWEGAAVDLYVTGALEIEDRIARIENKQVLRICFRQSAVLRMQSLATGLMDRDSWVLVHEVKA